MVLDEAYATCEVQDTLVAVWCGDPSEERVTALGAQLRAVAGRNAGRVYLYNVISVSAGMPSTAARNALQVQFNSMRGQGMACAILLEKTGADGALSRAILTTLVTVTRQPFPLRVFAVPRDAVSWLGSQGCSTSGTTILGLAQTLAHRLQSRASLLPPPPAAK